MATGGRGELLAVIRQTLEETLRKPQNPVKKPGKPRRKVKPAIAANLQGTVKPVDNLLQDPSKDTVTPANLQDTVKWKPANLLLQEDTAKPASYLPQDTVKPAKPPQYRRKPAQLPQYTVKADTASKLPQDTGKPAQIPQYTVKAATASKPPQDTGKPAQIPQYTVQAATASKLPQDTGKPAQIPQYTVKAGTASKPPQDTGKPAQIPQYTVKADTASKPPQDTGKPAQLPQYTVKADTASKPPQDTGKPAQIPQHTVKADIAAKLLQDTVVKSAKKKKKRKKKKISPTDLSTVQRLPAVCEEMAAQKAHVPHKVLSKRAGKSSLAPTRNFIQMLPMEILMKILSFLDVSSLDYISQVNKLFNQLANDDAIWQQLYLSEFGERRSWKPKDMDKMDMVREQDRPVGYWKRLYRTMIGNEVRMWKGELKHIDVYTGLPTQTKYVLRNRCISWELTVCDKQGKRGTFHDAQAHFSESSVIVCWSEGTWPLYHHLSTLQIHGVTNRGPKNRLSIPGCQSLMAKFDPGNLTRAPKVIGKDKIVKLVLLEPGLTVGFWRGQHNSIAFVMASFHFHKLVERSLLGTPLCPYSVPLVKPPFDDIDPEYGLHGYRLHICLHNTETQIMSGNFSHLFCRKAEIRHDFVRLTVIDKRNIAQHTILSGNITMPWKCAVLEGALENCCVLSLTLLDEFQKPFWCVSTPAAMDTKVKSPTYDYDGDHFRIEHRDSEGLVQMELVWMEEHRQYFLVYLAVFLSLHKVNKHYGREYFCQ